MATKTIRSTQNKNSNDFISRMPDDVLLAILCLLPLRDAVMTASLSTRWQYLWCYLINLDFHARETLDKIAKDQNLRMAQRVKYIHGVNNIIRCYKGPAIQYFRICFDLDCSFSREIDYWIRFAISKNVKNLELDFLENGERVRHPNQNYVFEKKLLNKRVGPACKWPTLNVVIMKIPFLRTLVMKNVNVSDEMLEILLRNCPVLETIAIHGSGYLNTVHIGGQSLALKHLEIDCCFDVKAIHMHDFNLVSFIYKGEKIDLSLVNLPKLEELSIQAGSSWLKNNLFRQISTCVSYIQYLKFDISHSRSSKIPAIPLVELPKVKKLKLKVGAWNDNSLLDLTLLAQACPNLEIFSIKLVWFSPRKKRTKVRHVANRPHPNLKTLEFVGYYGRTSDLELVVYFLDNAVALEKISIDPSCKVSWRRRILQDFTKKEDAARSSAKEQLQPITPCGIKLVIL